MIRWLPELAARTLASQWGSRLAAKLRSPVFLLALANLFNAALGFVSGMLTARWLGVGAYGIMGIITAINTTALNFVDLRLNDVMAKLYFRTDHPEGKTVSAYRASLIQSSMVCYACLAAVFFFLGLVANSLLPRFFTGAPLHWGWILASSAGTSITYFVNPIGYMQRLGGRFRLLVWQSMVGSILSSGLMILCVSLSKDLDGYYLGFVLSNSVGAVLALAVAVYAWVKLDKLPLFAAWDLSALRSFREHSRFLLWGNALGYLKLGHRSADLLLVGFFCNDEITGLYKLARTLTDKLLMLFDAMNQVYFPSFMRMLANGDFAAYQGLAKRILSALLIATPLLLLAEHFGLPFFMQLVLQGNFKGVEPLIVIMTIPFFFVTGMYIWIWPLVLHYNETARYTLFTGIALVFQYGIGILLFKAYGGPWAFPLGYVGHYVVLILLASILVYKKFPQALPFSGPSHAQNV